MSAAHRVAAGELRASGYVFDPEIPDQATVAWSAIEPVLLPSEGDVVCIGLRIHEPFTWLDLTFIVTPRSET